MEWDTVTPDEPLYVWVTDAELRAIVERNQTQLGSVPIEVWITTAELVAILTRNLEGLVRTQHPRASSQERQEDALFISRRRAALARLGAASERAHLMVLAVSRVPGANAREQKRYVTLAPVPTNDAITNH